jgi:hypothetical protein
VSIARPRRRSGKKLIFRGRFEQRLGRHTWTRQAVAGQMQHCVRAVASGTRCWGKKSAQERRAPVAPCALGRLVPVFASPRQGSEARAERMVEEVHTATACAALRCSAPQLSFSRAAVSRTSTQSRAETAQQASAKDG